jgi:hypothetical protein
LTLTALSYFNLSVPSIDIEKLQNNVKSWASSGTSTTSKSSKTNAGVSVPETSRASSTTLSSFNPSGMTQNKASNYIPNPVKPTLALEAFDRHTSPELSSSAISSSIGLQPTKAIDVDLFEENEEVERVAALSSPVKGGERLTSEVQNFLHQSSCLISLLQSLIKIEEQMITLEGAESKAKRH